MDTPNSHKKSPHSSAKSKRESSSGPEGSRRPLTDEEQKQFMDYSNDHVARVRAAKAAVIREMESFGDPSEYDVEVIHGQLTEKPVSPSQSSLLFQSDTPDDPEGAD